MAEQHKSDHDLLIEIRTLLTVMQKSLGKLERDYETQLLFNSSIDKRVSAIESDRVEKLADYKDWKKKVHDHANILQQARGVKLAVHSAMVAVGVLVGALIEGLAKGLIH